MAFVFIFLQLPRDPTVFPNLAQMCKAVLFKLLLSPSFIISSTLCFLLTANRAQQKQADKTM